MKRRSEEVVYLVRGGDTVKIGRTTNLASRLRALATGSAVPLELLATVPGGRKEEARLHRKWRHLHLRGEWFEAAPELLRYAQELAAGPPPVELSQAERAQAGQVRRILEGLGPADLAAVGLV
jgi:hypothetical protein